METWFLVPIALCVCFLFKPLLSPFLPSSITKPKLPPGPRSIPIIGSFLWLRKPVSELKHLIRNHQVQYGPIISLHIGSGPVVFIADRSLAHQALIQNGAVFADRPPALATNKYMSSNQHNISSAVYGPTWRLLRRNLTSEILHPSRVKFYGNARKWVLDILVNRLKTKSQSETEGGGVRVIEHFQYAMFCLLVLMCFGDKLNEEQVKEIERVERQRLFSIERFKILNFKPKLTKILLKNRWREFFKILEEQREVIVPLIRARQKSNNDRLARSTDDDDKDDEYVLSYTDTLLDLQLPDGNEKRKLSEDEMVNLCSEFLNAGTDTTSTALQWIMANVVKYPEVQEKLFAEIKEVMGETEEEVREEVLQKLPYLKAVILEGLRRHPPAHFVLAHAVTHDVVLDGHLVPKNGSVNVMVADIGWDPQVWEDPMAFKPERFLGGDEGFDLTGSREIKMMPFGVGRRICPGLGLAVLHLEYFVANLVWKFEWRVVEGDGVDLSEEEEFTVVMKNPLQAHLIPRGK